jgi:hypothetical protein
VDCHRIETKTLKTKKIIRMGMSHTKVSDYPFKWMGPFPSIGGPFHLQKKPPLMLLFYINSNKQIHRSSIKRNK